MLEARETLVLRSHTVREVAPVPEGAGPTLTKSSVIKPQEFGEFNENNGYFICP